MPRPSAPRPECGVRPTSEPPLETVGALLMHPCARHIRWMENDEQRIQAYVKYSIDSTIMGALVLGAVAIALVIGGLFLQEFPLFAAGLLMLLGACGLWLLARLIRALLPAMSTRARNKYPNV